MKITKIFKLINLYVLISCMIINEEIDIIYFYITFKLLKRKLLNRVIIAVLCSQIQNCFVENCDFYMVSLWSVNGPFANKRQRYLLFKVLVVGWELPPNFHGFFRYT